MADGDGASKTRVADALKRSLEGELVELAYAPARLGPGPENHSKTGVQYHSKQGHDHSKTSITSQVQTLTLDPATDAKYLKFAEELARVKSAVDQES